MKTTVFLVRHAECLGNVLKDKFLHGEGPRPDHLPEYRNSRLTMRGSPQSYLAGRFMWREHLTPIDQFLVSDLWRPYETASVIAYAAQVGGYTITRMGCLNELSKSPVVKIVQRIKDKARAGVELDGEDKADIISIKLSFNVFVSLLSVMRIYHGLEAGLEFADCFRPCMMDAYIGFTIRYPESLRLKAFPDDDANGKYGEYIMQIGEWILAQKRKEAIPNLKELTERRQFTIPCDDGEMVRFGLDGGSEIFISAKLLAGTRRKIEKEVEKSGKRTFAVVLHAKRLIRLRQEIEGFDEAEYQRLTKLNGQDFPQNVSFTQYEYEDGVWTLVGEPYRLPKGLVVVEGTRRLGFELGRRDFEAICSKLGFDPKEVEDPLLDRLS